MKFSPETTLSVAVPVHNMAGRLQNLEFGMRESFDSELPIEFTLVHDGVDMATEKELKSLAKKFKATYIQVNLRSPGLSRNVALETIKSPWVTFWDCDDLGHPQEVYQAISNVIPSAQAIIGAFKQIDTNIGIESRAYKNPHNLNALMINPGIWRWVFKREFIGRVRFPKTSMGEDQVFLASLHLKMSDIQFSDNCFYSYFTNVEEQLTSDKSRISELRESIIEVENISQRSSSTSSYVFVLRAKMILTAYRRKIYSFQEFWPKFFLGPKGPLNNRFKSLQGSILVLYYVVKKALN